MKNLLLLLMALPTLQLQAQTITFTNFSQRVNDTETVFLAVNSSFDNSLKVATGNGVVWDARGLTKEPSYPLLHLVYDSPASTPFGSLYPMSNYVVKEANLSSAFEYNYVHLSSDSLVDVGNYQPSTEHEIFQDPDKRLIFPFAYGQSFTDQYAKTNYSDATTVSSNQTGTRTVTFAGFGTLRLPQGDLNNVVALITEVRTNSLGPDSYYYTWYNITNGQRVMLRTENNGNITTAYMGGTITGLKDPAKILAVAIAPNPASNQILISINDDIAHENYAFLLMDLYGRIVKQAAVSAGENRVDISKLARGVYVYKVAGDKATATGRLLLQ